MVLMTTFIDLEYIEYMLRYDTVHGKFEGEISSETVS
jgi:glyceraldehyde 3-phosphate dehydrogenase